MRVYQPMLAKTSKEFLKGDNYIYEPKYDGIRCIAYIEKDGSFKLINRSLIDVTARFPEIGIEVDTNCILDGELVCFNDNRRPDFQLMQTRMNRKHDIEILAEVNPAKFIPFDIIEYGGDYLGALPLAARKSILDVLTPDSTLWWTSEDTIAPQSYLEQGWEGIMIKTKSGTYQPATRSSYWMKHKFLKSIEAVVLGYTQGFGRRLHTFGALVLGVENESNNYEYIGECGTGFTDMEVENLKRLMDSVKLATPLEIDGPQQVKVWCNPVIKILVQFLEISNDGLLRFPAYKGLVE